MQTAVLRTSCPCPRAVSIWRIWEFTKAGAEPGLLKPGLCSESLHNPASSQSHLCTWCFVCICWSHASMLFSPFTFHSFTAKASSARLWCHPEYPFCWVHFGLHIPRGASRVPSLHNKSAWPRQVQLNSQDCVKHKGCSAGTSCSTAMSWAPGKMGTEEVNCQC